MHLLRPAQPEKTLTMLHPAPSTDMIRQRLQKLSSAAISLAKTLHLFTVDIIQPVIIPWTVVGICSALAGPAVTNIPQPNAWDVVVKSPQAFLWMWLIFLTFAIGNQRLPDAVHEDTINKPWRPIPSGRLTMPQAKALLLALVPVQITVGTWLGVGRLTILALVLSYLYNDLGAADLHWIPRNAINAFAIIVACTGSALIVAQDQYDHAGMLYSDRGMWWIWIQAALILTTIQVQDLRDQKGDSLRARKTMPLDLGDGFTRWSVAVTVMLWSWYCPVFWKVDMLGISAILALGSYLVSRVLLWRDVTSDRLSWKIWGLWSLAIFLLPLYSRFADGLSSGTVR